MNLQTYAGTLSKPLNSWLGRLSDPSLGPDLSDDFYLAGSAAIALHCQHREVWDLDLMSPARRLTSAERRDLLQALMARDSALRVETARDGYLSLRAGDNTGIRFFYYPYPVVAPTGEWQGCEIASRLDLALMKLAAIISRGTKKDFVDLFLLLNDWPSAGQPPGEGVIESDRPLGQALPQVLEQAPSKFGHVLDFPWQALKALGDRGRADSEPMPPLTTALGWDQVEGWLDGPVRAYAQRQVGLGGESSL